VAASVGVAGLVAGGVFHAQALASKSDAEALFAGPEFDAELDRFEHRRALALGGYAVGAVGVGVGLYLLLRPGDRPAERRVSLEVGGGGLAVTWSGPL
jgi:hypothetical protein